MAKAELDLPLGKTTEYVSNYTPSLLRSIDRETYRNTLGLGEEPPFYGEDLWNCYELSWLGPEGKPEVAALRVQVPSTSPSIVESKSVKLYLNSFSQTEFQNRTEVLSAIDSDLGIAFRANIVIACQCEAVNEAAIRAIFFDATGVPAAVAERIGIHVAGTQDIAVR